MTATASAIKKKEDSAWAALMKQIWGHVDEAVKTKGGIASPETQKELARIADEERTRMETKSVREVKPARAVEEKKLERMVVARKERAEVVTIDAGEKKVSVDARTSKAVEDLADMFEKGKPNFRKWVEVVA